MNRSERGSTPRRRGIDRMLGAITVTTIGATVIFAAAISPDTLHVPQIPIEWSLIDGTGAIPKNSQLCAVIGPQVVWYCEGNGYSASVSGKDQKFRVSAGDVTQSLPLPPADMHSPEGETVVANIPNKSAIVAIFDRRGLIKEVFTTAPSAEPHFGKSYSLDL